MEAVEIASAQAPGSLVIEAPCGPVRGKCRRFGFRVEGIPYAAPPVGDLLP